METTELITKRACYHQEERNNIEQFQFTGIDRKT